MKAATLTRLAIAISLAWGSSVQAQAPYGGDLGRKPSKQALAILPSKTNDGILLDLVDPTRPCPSCKAAAEYVELKQQPTTFSLAGGDVELFFSGRQSVDGTAVAGDAATSFGFVVSAQSKPSVALSSRLLGKGVELQGPFKLPGEEKYYFTLLDPHAEILPIPIVEPTPPPPPPPPR